MTCDDVNNQHIKPSFIKGISLGGLLLPSPEMTGNALINYLVIIKISESDENRECSSRRDFAVKSSQSFLEGENFPFLSLGKCIKHDSRTIVNIACRIFSNILLNFCFNRNDLLTSNNLSRKKTADFYFICQV